jgi:hypothetical protein
VVVAKLGNDAGIIGAAFLGNQNIGIKPQGEEA